MLRKAKKAAIIVIIAIFLMGVLVFVPVPLPVSGGEMQSVAITECVLAEDEATLSIKAMVFSSIGYIKTYKAKRDGDKLYLSFYSTFGLNNPYGAKDEFDIDVTDINFIYQHNPNGYDLIWQRE